MKPILFLFALQFCLVSVPGFGQTRTSSNYSITTEAQSSGVHQTTSTQYTVDATVGLSPVGVATSMAYTAKAGYIAQLIGLDDEGVPGDINGDGCVNVADFFVMQANFNQTGVLATGDLDGDGMVNIGDFFILQANFNNCAGPVDEPQVAALLEALEAALVGDLDREADNDGDGLSNGHELDARTNPFDRNDFFAIIGVVAGDNEIELGWKSVVGEAYVIEYSTTGEPDSWRKLDAVSEPFVARESTMVEQFAAIAPKGKNAVFYRVRCVRH